MKASLDTNVILHLYRSNNQTLLFEMFDEEIYIDEFIYNVELQNHGKDILPALISDIKGAKILVIDNQELKRRGIWPLYKEYFEEESQLYPNSDMGEMHAIALARSLGATSVVTDDTKLYGPHYYLVRVKDSEIIPLTFYEILILLYMKGKYTVEQTIEIFYSITETFTGPSYSIKSKISDFARRFIQGRYSERDKRWFKKYCTAEQIHYRKKLAAINDVLKNQQSLC